MLTLSVVLSGIALFVSGMTFILVLVLMGGKDHQYTSREDLEQVEARLAARQSQLWRYLEAVDDHTGADGHQVLGVWMPGEKAPAEH